MARTLAALIVLSSISTAHAQGVLNRAGESLDGAGRSIRQGVEKAVARGQATAREHEIHDRVVARLHSDKRFRNAAIHVEVADGSVILSGSVADDAAKAGAVELAENTYGAEAVVDELVVGKEVRVGDARRDVRVVEPKKVVRNPEPRRITRSVPTTSQTTITIKP
ncbi:BON domain-containing protein [Paludisphaera mucosa]|uniref:BON domain-containing protein n=1 Tax=Paludisphaera mucosa TaxID=3030827 RepID=A0ABT6F463_9BACT|nr:BON domain-containing protein [Paludisphaera mucosa]MDG3002377.1 BON domain-containing protein [Paludisphaera mucosa]